MKRFKRFKLRINLQPPEDFRITKKEDKNWSLQSTAGSIAPLFKSLEISREQISRVDRRREGSLNWEGGCWKKGSLHPEIAFKIFASDIIFFQDFVKRKGLICRQLPRRCSAPPRPRSGPVSSATAVRPYSPCRSSRVRYRGSAISRFGRSQV